MESWLKNTEEKARIIHSQIAAFMQEMNDPEMLVALKNEGVTVDEVLAPWYKELSNLYTNEFPIAKLKDNSDLLIRAIGVNADHDFPMLKTVTRLADKMKENLNNLSKSVSPMMQAISSQKIADIPWIFNGYAPGSIMMGFSLKEPDSQNSIFPNEDIEFYKILSQTAQSIAYIPEFVEEEKLSSSIVELITDPFMRDVTIVAAWNISPTAKSGIHTIEVGSRTGGYGELTEKSRQILHEEIKQPKLLTKHTGSFTGILEQADLGRERATLRNIDAEGISAIRCATPIELSHQLINCFGKYVKITGEYEADASGKPRLFSVHKIEKIESKQLSIKH